MGIRDELVWRRDWSKHPNGWKAYAAFAVVWTLLGTAYLAGGNLFGIGHLVLAAASVLIARYAYRKARQLGPY